MRVCSSCCPNWIVSNNCSLVSRENFPGMLLTGSIFLGLWVRLLAASHLSAAFHLSDFDKSQIWLHKIQSFTKRLHYDQSLWCRLKLWFSRLWLASNAKHIRQCNNLAIHWHSIFVWLLRCYDKLYWQLLSLRWIERFQVFAWFNLGLLTFVVYNALLLCAYFGAV